MAWKLLKQLNNQSVKLLVLWRLHLLFRSSNDLSCKVIEDVNITIDDVGYQFQRSTMTSYTYVVSFRPCTLSAHAHIPKYKNI